ANDLRRAVDAGDFVAHFQPVVEVATGRLVSFEALARWRRKHGEVVAPAGFIAMAEEIGLIDAIDHAVLRQACEQVRAWRETMPDSPLTVSVNVSGRQFRNPNLFERL